MKKSEKIFLAAFLALTSMIIVFMNMPPKAIDSIITESSITLFPVSENLKKSIEQTFKNGNSVYCKPNLNSEVSLSIEAIEGEYTASQTAIYLDTFFENYPPNSFIIKHQGTNKTKTEKLWIGEYETVNSALFTIYIYAEEGKIYNIEIETEEVTSLLWK